MNVLEQAADFLAEQRKLFASDSVEYQSISGTNLTVQATVGQTVFKFDDISGFTVRVVSTDFIILAGDLGFIPEKGDQIIFKNRRYEVLAPNNEHVWRWSGSAHDTYRIHTKHVDDVFEWDNE